MSFTAIDLFAGVGGFRLAVERCGGRCVGFSEINPDAVRSYIDNHPASAGTNFGDITELKELPRHDLLMGGVPCQSWSIAGRNLGFDDDRGQLWNDALCLLNQSRPKAFIFENVKGLADPRNKKALDHILSRIRDAGYHAGFYVLNSFDYGVPQSRVRIYIVGFLEERHFRSFRLPAPVADKITLKDILDEPSCVSMNGCAAPVVQGKKMGATSLSTNNNGFNDYFLFNDLRNGSTTIHSWDIIATTKRQKHICLLLLRNRRKKEYGFLDGNPLALRNFQELDDTICQTDLDGLVELGILKPEKYAHEVLGQGVGGLTDDEKVILAKQKNQTLIPDALVCDRDIRIRRVNLASVFESLERKQQIRCVEIRYDFRYTKISTGLFGISRIFLPSSNIFPTLVASDSSDYVTPVSIVATSEVAYRTAFVKQVLEPKRFRKISKSEACRIQGFPDNFKLPESRSRWMKLLGNSVSVPVIERLIKAVCDTGVFGVSATHLVDGSESIVPRRRPHVYSETSRPVQLVLLEGRSRRKRKSPRDYDG